MLRLDFKNLLENHEHKKKRRIMDIGHFLRFVESHLTIFLKFVHSSGPEN